MTTFTPPQNPYGSGSQFPGGQTLPDSIRENGSIEQRLSENGKGAGDSQDRESLRRRLLSALKDIRQRIQDPTHSTMSGNAPPPVQQRLSQVLRGGEESGPSVVLRHAIATREGLSEIAEKLRRAAINEVDESPELYLALMVGLLPDDISRAAAGCAADKRYRDGANRTAADDWDVYRRGRARRRPTSGSCRIGVPTGISKLDEALGGGLHGLTFLCGNKGRGKTSLMLKSTLEATLTSDDIAVLFYSFDMTKEVIYDRLLCSLAGVSIHEYLNPDAAPGVAEKVQEAERLFTDRVAPRIRVVERSFAREVIRTGKQARTENLSFTCERICGDANSLLAQTGMRRLLIVIDLFQKAICPESVQSSEQDAYRLDVLDQVRKTSRCSSDPEGFVILVASESRKDVGDEMTFDDLKGDGRMASDADVVLLMLSGKAPKGGLVRGETPVVLRIAKGRDGVVRCDIPLIFEYDTYGFADAEATARNSTTTRSTRASQPPANQVDPLTE